MRAVPTQPCLGLIHAFEGHLGTFEPRAIQDPSGNWEIGWSHKLSGPTDVVWDQARADQQALDDLGNAAAGVCATLGAAVDKLTDGQYAALIDFTYNEGVSRFATSTLSRMVISGQMAAVPNELRKWKYSKDPRTGQEVVLQGLVNRREAEVRVWLT